MAKNLIPEVAKLLGVEIGEEFIIQNADRKETVVLTMDVFYVITPNKEHCSDRGNLLIKVLQGLYEVKKLPWDPKNCDDYYVLNVETGRIECYSWGATTFDLALKALNMVYRTREEAEAHMAEDYERLTGRKLHENA